MLLEKVALQPYFPPSPHTKKMDTQTSETSTALRLLASKIKELLQEHRLSFIEDPLTFKREYSERMHKAKNTFDLNSFQIPLTQFNTEEIACPRLEKGVVIFYACDHHKVPYRVTMGEKKVKAKIETLPLL